MYDKLNNLLDDNWVWYLHIKQKFLGCISLSLSIILSAEVLKSSKSYKPQQVDDLPVSLKTWVMYLSLMSPNPLLIFKYIRNNILFILIVL